MTEKEYIEWDNNLYAVNKKIKGCEAKLIELNNVYSLLSNKKYKINCVSMNIQFEKQNEYFHGYYTAYSDKINNCIKSEIENEITKNKKLICSYKKEKEELLNSISIKKD